jgi:hypothetical protein
MSFWLVIFTIAKAHLACTDNGIAARTRQQFLAGLIRK